MIKPETINTQVTKYLLWLFITGFIFQIVGCGESNFYERKQSMEGGIWTYADSLNFEVDITDTVQLYALLLDINHSVDYKKQNLYVYIHTQMPDGERLGKQLNIDLAPSSGEWYGECGRSSCDVLINLQRKAYFNQMGKHKFTIKQHMRQDSLPGINSITFRMKEIIPESANQK